jgi:hypothetical protein
MTYSPLVRPVFLPWCTDSYISARILTHGLLIALMMEAAGTSETSVNFYQTKQRNIPEDSYLHTRRRENLKSPQVYAIQMQRMPINTKLNIPLNSRYF